MVVWFVAGCPFRGGVRLSVAARFSLVDIALLQRPTCTVRSFQGWLRGRYQTRSPPVRSAGSV